MSRTTKLVLDILMGAVVPIIILNNLSKPLSAPVAYVFAALVPVGWIFIDLFFITRRFNVITGYVGLSAIVRGLLAFWFVDGLLFAIKDTVGLLLTVLVFAGSLLITRPMLYYFLVQNLNPDTAAKQQSLDQLLSERPVYRALVRGTLVIVAVNVLAAITNFVLNLWIVVAQFGTEAFNQQVAQVNAITRIALTIPEFVGFGWAFWLVYRALFTRLPSEEGKAQFDSDFWELMRLREAQSQ